jgi:hypothetical protein
LMRGLDVGPQDIGHREMRPVYPHDAQAGDDELWFLLALPEGCPWAGYPIMVPLEEGE